MIGNFAIIFKHALKRCLAQPVNVLVVLVLPLSLIFIPGPDTDYPFGLYLYGLLGLFSAFLLCKPLVEERINKVSVRILATPVDNTVYLGSHLLAYVLILVLQSTIFLVGVHLRWMSLGINVFWVGTLYLAYNMMAIAFCLFWNSLFKVYNLAFGVFSGVASFMCLVSGISMTLSAIPEEIRRFTIILPTYWLPNGLQSLYNGDIKNVLVSVAVLLLYAGLFFMISGRRRN